MKAKKTCFIIAGPNGAGKTTFARDFLPKEGACVNYLNADLIASGLSPFAPEKANVTASKLMLLEIRKCVEEGKSFAFETTLSGASYVKKIMSWKKSGYGIILYYFSLPSAEMALDRVRYRVEQGGHGVPESVIRRRFERSLINLDHLFKPIVDAWVIFDTSSSNPRLIGGSIKP
uniref:Predicted ABC-type ATPase n=1 Tax=Candidatus Kentrum sp. TC TaxID=2126339 RepID=A0A450ZU47_9GAMM|nr:MAG: Predicted ABC-type ATPase [Candidatus Kentron sp. TC]VFK42940.1 MAG: Predicted ABC-type ATPase [Candidatus Kentron sp. TC]VFK57277.1 MAG: Predicted ABC-type ATPase [Candidatus Kentron sp. TC]